MELPPSNTLCAAHTAQVRASPADAAPDPAALPGSEVLERARALLASGKTDLTVLELVCQAHKERADALGRDHESCRQEDARTSIQTGHESCSTHSSGSTSWRRLPDSHDMTDMIFWLLLASLYLKMAFSY